MARQEALLRLHKTLAARRTELRKRLGHRTRRPRPRQALVGLRRRRRRGVRRQRGGNRLHARRAGIEGTRPGRAGPPAAEDRHVRQVRGVSVPRSRSRGSMPCPTAPLCIKCQREIESEGGWLHGRSAADWARIAEGGNPMEEREVSPRRPGDRPEQVDTRDSHRPADHSEPAACTDCGLFSFRDAALPRNPAVVRRSRHPAVGQVG